jgi:hypothetical protein
VFVNGSIEKADKLKTKEQEMTDTKQIQYFLPKADDFS